jgi:diphthamide biosynthesis methyltransferase
MVLHLVGLGLGDEKDVTIKGMEAIKGSAHVYLEAYTSVLGGELAVEKLEAFYGCTITVADREMVEERYVARPPQCLCRRSVVTRARASGTLWLRPTLQGRRDHPAGSEAGCVVPGDR